jgi:hypothetical protein
VRACRQLLVVQFCHCLIPSCCAFWLTWQCQ